MGRLVDRAHQRTSSSVASWSQAVCLQAITVSGAEHSIGLMQPRMLGGRKWVAICSWVDDAGTGATIADAVMP